MEMTEADDNVTSVKCILNKESISEYSLSDNEDGLCFSGYAPPSSDPINGDGDSSASSTSSSEDNYSILYGPVGIVAEGGQIEVAGEWASDKSVEMEGGIGRLARHVTVKDAPN